MAFIPARGGSKGLPGKNLAEVGGTSLVCRAVAVADRVPQVDEVVVSSDDAAVLEHARACGATTDPRSRELARDDTPTIDVLREFLARRREVERVVLLQPTSPLREVGDVVACLEALDAAPTAVTVVPCEHPPEWSLHLDAGGGVSPLLGWDALPERRQDARPSYRVNGAVYAARAEQVRRGGPLVGPGTVGVVMPSRRSVDVDDEIGLALARLLVGEQGAGGGTA